MNCGHEHKINVSIGGKIFCVNIILHKPDINTKNHVLYYIIVSPLQKSQNNSTASLRSFKLKPHVYVPTISDALQRVKAKVISRLCAI